MEQVSQEPKENGYAMQNGAMNGSSNGETAAGAAAVSVTAHKGDGDKHKSSSDKHHHSSSSHHKSSKENRDKDKHRDGKHHSSSSSHSKDHKSSSSSHKSSSDKDKHHHKSSSGSSSSKDKHKSSEHKSSSDDKQKNSSSSSHHKDKSGSSSDKHRSSSDHKDRDKHKSSSSKHKSSSHDKEKQHKSSSGDKHKNHSADGTSIKSETTNHVKQEVQQIPEVKPEPMEVDSFTDAYDKPPPTPEMNIVAPPEVKPEVTTSQDEKDDDFSDDDVPLASRVKQEPMKSYAESSDDEPLTAKLAKIKKETKKSSKKRKSTMDSDASLDDDDDDSDYDKKKKKKKSAAASTPKKAKMVEASPQKKKKGADTSNSGASPTKKKKQAEEQEVWKWWEEEKRDDGVKWTTLEHRGPVFAPLYEPLPDNVNFYYDGKKMKLSLEAEEVAGFYGRMIDHDYTSKEIFNKNFFADWRKVMTREEREKIADLKKCNFKEIDAYYKKLSEERKNRTKEEKAAEKKANEDLLNEYGFCIIDGHKQRIANFRIEPPGLFRGRGEHPKMGMHKKRVQPEDVIINIGKNAPVPKPPEGHRWKEVRHDNKVSWLSSWTENIAGQVKYIMLNPSSKLKGEKDWQKYETARRLKSCVDKIRRNYTQDFKSKEMRIRQRAVALYFIDKLALRAGNEKDADEAADTVGCCSLRVEHITLHDEKDGKEHVVEFDFLGKDSIRYQNSVPVEKRVFKNVKLFMENKQGGDDLFDRLNTAILNKHLQELMDGLTAKVFRTYNASKTLQEQLELLTQEDMNVHEKMLAYNRANRAVAILCNHQRAVPKTFNKSMENLQAKIDEKDQQIRELRKEMKAAKKEGDHSGYEKKQKRLKQLEDQLKRLEVQATDKEENKQIALGTSKLNYLDPRISVAWCKKWDVPIEKVYNKTQREKFRWAIDMAGPDYEF